MNPGRLTARALKNSNVYVGRSTNLAGLMPDGAINRLVMSATTHLFNLLLNQAAAMKVRRLEDRIVVVLKNCARFQGQDLSQDAVELEWGISQVEFANLLGVARPYLNKAIRQLEQSGVLEFNGDRVVLDECRKKKGLEVRHENARYG
ncbi:helix-turn-helix domain-containing protein [Pseudohoeflea suaedae]|nr:helix-turn-helix domain-containing protein [Pseudohoeflea suaedae]